MRDCPSCGRPVDGLECLHCGHGATKSERSGGKVLAASHKPAIIPPRLSQDEWDKMRSEGPAKVRAALAKIRGKP